jgi:hypothetical protein
MLRVVTFNIDPPLNIPYLIKKYSIPADSQLEKRFLLASSTLNILKIII